MTPRIRDAWAASVLMVGALGSAGLAFGVQAALARSLSPSEYGRFAAALAVVTIIAPAVGFGVPAFWLKAYGTEGWAAKRWMEVSMRFIARSALICLVMAALWAWFCTTDAGTRELLLWMLPVVLVQGAIEMASVKLQLEEKFGRVAMWQALQHTGRLVLVMACWQSAAGSEALALGFGCIGAIVTLGAWRSVSALRRGTADLVGHGFKPAAEGARENRQTPQIAELWRNVMPFGVSSLLFYAYGQSGLLIVSHLGTPRDVAVYSVAVTILTALYLLPTVLFQKLLMPRLHRWAASGDERLERLFRDGNKWMFALGVAVAGISALLAPIGIPLVFGGQYEQSVSVVVLMTLCTPFRFLTVSASSVMTTHDLLQVRNRCAAAALLFSVVAGIIGVSAAGIVGAVVASVAGEVVWAALSILCTRHFLFRSRHGPTPGAEAQGSADSALPSVLKQIPVSVIIPCFNCRSTIERAIQSVFEQTCRPQELILVDDCSTDGTREILRELVQTYPSNWIRLLLQPRNAGPGAARNAAWAATNLPYIAFLDSDDSWHPAKMAIQYGWMHAHPDAAITGHPVALLGPDDHPASRPWPDVVAPRHMARRRILFSNRFTPSSIVMRADVRGRFDETKRHAEDYYMLLEVVLVDGGEAYLFPRPLSYVYKAQFGAQTGLSAQLWKIQKGEQDNYLRLRRRGVIGRGEWLCFSLLSAAKYLRRCVLSRRFT
ncbi:glycosyltransferase [Paraburkholderia terricola]|uniref:O-antigen/teichoic acid export membrane protein/glycosyltransferase involved in cell wall biosynthesis n=1 Tax=Paraburkholderia terricola TaxID=169427 RepID=A0ABU1LK48_9BURK|nr:glycosyltransferase [Paraburkholderia terricola]MDR6407093.1 O-antigen/teichoic acid export membrane protein/glycosyltransferase involved in cell wall biosynthesis [Paraburkholderia terricola]MDR6479229.1 O-antigen/teichoic acid export membrane protein/glycosyltransferase involved in cell wall biosynthesis [Paraburkholderia terricola]